MGTSLGFARQGGKAESKWYPAIPAPGGHGGNTLHSKQWEIKLEVGAQHNIPICNALGPQVTD